MGKSILLLIWIFIFGIYHSNYIMFRNSGCYDLLSAVCRRLPLVVAIFYCFRWMRILCIPVFSILFCIRSNIYFFYILTRICITHHVFLFIQLEITEFIPSLLYFGYSFLISFTVWILTGTIGFFSSYFFVSKIYAAVKID